MKCIVVFSLLRLFQAVYNALNIKFFLVILCYLTLSGVTVMSKTDYVETNIKKF